jgi:hypothetical protein
MWLEAESLVEMRAIPTFDLGNFEELPISLADLHRYFFYYFNQLAHQKKGEEFRRFQERERLNRQVSEAAMSELTTVLKPQQAEFSREGTSLLIAAGAVGRALGIMVEPPAQSEDLSRVKNPLDAIARASRFRTRRVLLAGDWWHREYGPLLGYTLSDNSPVALLPHNGNHYVLFDPIARTRTHVTRAVAETLSPEAQMFYRPLPLVVRNAAALFRCLMRRCLW